MHNCTPSLQLECSHFLWVLLHPSHTHTLSSSPLQSLVGLCECDVFSAHVYHPTLPHFQHLIHTSQLLKRWRKNTYNNTTSVIASNTETVYVNSPPPDTVGGSGNAFYGYKLQQVFCDYRQLAKYICILPAGVWQEDAVRDVLTW